VYLHYFIEFIAFMKGTNFLFCLLCFFAIFLLLEFVVFFRLRHVFMKPNKRCSGLGWSALYQSPTALAAELWVRPLNSAKKIELINVWVYKQESKGLKTK